MPCTAPYSSRATSEYHWCRALDNTTSDSTCKFCFKNRRGSLCCEKQRQVGAISTCCQLLPGTCFGGCFARTRLLWKHLCVQPGLHDMMHMHTCIHAQMHTFCFLALLSAVVLLTMKNAPSPPRQLRVQKIQKAQIQQQVASSPDCDCGDAPLIDGINALNIFSLAGVEHKLKNTR